MDKRYTSAERKYIWNEKIISWETLCAMWGKLHRYHLAQVHNLEGSPMQAESVSQFRKILLSSTPFNLLEQKSQGRLQSKRKGFVQFFPLRALRNLKILTTWTAYSFAQKRVNRNCQKDKGSTKCFYSDTVSDFFVKSTAQRWFYTINLLWFNTYDSRTYFGHDSRLTKMIT